MGVYSQFFFFSLVVEKNYFFFNVGLMKTANINIVDIGSIRRISTAKDRIAGIVSVTRLVLYNTRHVMNVWIR